MSYEQLDLFQDFDLDKITDHIIKSFNSYAGNKGYCLFNKYLEFILHLDKLNFTVKELRDKIISNLFVILQEDMSANFVKYFDLNDINIFHFRNLFVYKNEPSNYRYVKKHNGAFEYIEYKNLGKFLQSYQHDNVVEFFDLLLDKPIKFRVIKVWFESIEEG